MKEIVYKDNKIAEYSDYCLAFYFNADKEIESHQCRNLEAAKKFLDNIQEFPIGFKEYSISRQDYEDMPCPMMAHTWTDEQMEFLAQTINRSLSQYSFDETSPYYEDDLDDAFWKEMEDCAVSLGMKYYDD
jgi:hypothetical protein